jgi:hypothetical protein
MLLLDPKAAPGSTRETHPGFSSAFPPTWSMSFASLRTRLPLRSTISWCFPCKALAGIAARLRRAGHPRVRSIRSGRLTGTRRAFSGCSVKRSGARPWRL